MKFQSPCPTERSRVADCGSVEALVYDELSPDDAALVIRHVASCDRCAAERALLQAERRAFATRSRLRTPAALPSFDVMMARANGSIEASARSPEAEERPMGRTLWQALVPRLRASWTSVAIAASAVAAVGTLLLISTTESPFAANRAQSPLETGFAGGHVPAAPDLRSTHDASSLVSECDGDSLICVDESVAFVSAPSCAAASAPLDVEEAASHTSNVFASFGEESSAMCVAGSM